MNDLFDFSQLDELMSADPDELCRVLWDLFKDFGASFSVMPSKLDDLQVVGMEAHQLRGVGSSFGLKAVAEKAKDLETAAGQGQRDVSAVTITEIQQLLITSEAELRKLRPQYFQGN